MILKRWEKQGLQELRVVILNLLPWKQTQQLFNLQQHLTLKKTWRLMKPALIQQ